MDTLHHQMIYRVHNHSMDLHFPNSTNDALYMFTDRDHDLAIINIPRKIPTKELAQIMLLKWINNFEKEFHSTLIYVHTIAPPLVQRMLNGTVRSITKDQELRDHYSYQAA
ncbi:hypothetical protein K1719_033466 [Acacia pycnantha]|nr:hypothetical protein K1719_033466 [Acacia pycnantha]